MARGVGRRGLRGLGVIICLSEERGRGVTLPVPHSPTRAIMSFLYITSLYRYPVFALRNLNLGPSMSFILSFFLVRYW